MVKADYKQIKQNDQLIAKSQNTDSSAVAKQQQGTLMGVMLYIGRTGTATKSRNECTAFANLNGNGNVIQQEKLLLWQCLHKGRYRNNDAGKARANMQHISNFVHKRIFSTEERNMKGRDLLRPWLVADRKIQLLSLPDTQSFVTDLCWGSGVPVEGIPGKRSQPVASDSAALKSAAEQFNHVYSGLLDALPRIDADRLSEAGRDAPIKSLQDAPQQRRCI